MPRWKTSTRTLDMESIPLGRSWRNLPENQSRKSPKPTAKTPRRSSRQSSGCSGSEIPPFWFLARTISWFTAPNVVIRFRATPSSAMSQGAAESPCITPLVPTSRSCSINPNAASTYNGAMSGREPIPSRWWCTARIVPDFSQILPA